MSAHENPLPRSARRVHIRWCAPLLLPIVVIVAYVVIGSLGREPFEANSSEVANAQCTARIERELSAPSTAEFFDSSATGDGTWIVTGMVEAENGFGAMIRDDYRCTVVISGNGARTTLDRLG